MLCENCKAVFGQPLTFVQKQWQWDRWEAQHEYSTTLSGLEQNAEHCYGCRGLQRKLMGALEAPNAPTVQTSSPLRVTYFLAAQADQEKGSTRVWNSVYFEGAKLGTQNMCLEKAPEEAESKICSSNTGSAETLDKARAWLDQCRTHHPACSAGLTDTWYPTRLIEVQPDSVRLIETAEADLSEPYLSLSHCWGGAEILRLETKTLSSFKSDIPFLSLPKNFQDAVVVVRGLGLKYIWIDSLCIIQDSDEDWKQEAQMMAKVYQYAVCNIAATNSKNSHRGFFRERNISLVMPNVLDLDNGALKGRFRLYDEEYFGQEVDDAPLNRRCWVTQERILSRRIIHFSSDQVIWDCVELAASESVSRIPPLPASSAANGRIGRKQGSPFQSSPASLDDSLTQWARIVNAYSACGLTVLGDKLIAMSGLAEVLHNQVKLKHCAGLWFPHKMEMQLAWYIQDRKPNDFYRNHLAPTWSWASINNAVVMPQLVDFEGYDITPLASITEARIHEERWDDRSMTAMGSLRIRCTLNPVQLKGDAQQHSLEGKGMEHGPQAHLDSPDVVGAENLYFMPLFELQTPASLTDKWNLYSNMWGLLLQGEKGNPGIYRRCGQVVLSGQTIEATKAFDPTYEALKSPAGKQGLPCINYDAATGHFITLV